MLVKIQAYDYSLNHANRLGYKTIEAALVDFEQLLELCRGIKWKSTDKDNMEFRGDIIYTQHDKFLKLLEKKTMVRE